MTTGTCPNCGGYCYRDPCEWAPDTSPRAWDDRLDARTMVLAVKLYSLGWSSPTDAQLRNLDSALSDLAAILATNQGST